MTNWPRLIRQLERHMRHIDIATCVDRSEGWVGLLKRGTIRQPPYEQGRLIVELCERYAIEVSRETQYPQVDTEESA